MVSATQQLVLLAAILVMFAEPVSLSNRGLAPHEVSAPPPIRVDTQLLSKIVRPISTVTEYSDGHVEYNDGSGFVAGSRFLTVNHNLEPSEDDGVVRRTSFMDGVAIKPLFGDATEDLAVFDIPLELCNSECNDILLDTNVQLERGEHLFWIRKFGAELTQKEATVLGYAWIGDPPAASGIDECPGNLIVQVDQPFEQGTSGSPIVAVNSGKIVGIIQGTLIDRDGSQSGFFKPLNCLRKVTPVAPLHPGVGP